MVLADVKKEWNDFQSKRDRSAVYGYLHMVFMQVDWWAKIPWKRMKRCKLFGHKIQNWCSRQTHLRQ